MASQPFFEFSGHSQYQQVMSDPKATQTSASTTYGSTNPVVNNIFGALGSVLGYVGAEAATALTFERLLWPQRFYSNFKPSSIIPITLLTPMSGPLHKIGLIAMDRIFQHGLLKGAHQGHMLGTSFFPEQGWTYTMYGDDTDSVVHKESIRNCLWTRAISYMKMPPIINSPVSVGTPGSMEKGAPQILRARITVSHLTIAPATPAEKESTIPFVSEDSKTPSLRVFLGILCSELTGVVTAIIVLAKWRSAWAALWVLPLFIRVLSAVFAVHREELIPSTSSTSSDDPWHKFEVHCPQSDGNFMLLSGPPTLVLQFFRHYGHPKRDRFREVLQLMTVVLFICLFPMELLCSIVWMPLEIQYVWLGYKMYVVLAMHIVRYSQVGSFATTEAKVSDAFGEQLCGRCTAGAERECSILFGHARQGPETLKVNLSITYHNRYKEGQDSLRNLLSSYTGALKGQAAPISHSNFNGPQAA
ncbi:hypothetical protein GGR52DRAFT_219450 [Hypoxylon sp. FL1284]|nr:hypothetical protein GGR52DRAFT_219450 [Hypoxylon sp. FL1284]